MRAYMDVMGVVPNLTTEWILGMFYREKQRQLEAAKIELKECYQTIFELSCTCERLQEELYVIHCARDAEAKGKTWPEIT